MSTSHYIDNKAFYAALKDYRAACDANPDDIPRVPEYIGECIVKIATGLAKRPNFAGYSWRDEMIGDAIETCLKYVKSFDPERSTSPFGYFTTTCWYSFIGRIATEKKQSKIKRALVSSAGFDTFSLQEQDGDGEYTLQLNDFINSLGDEEPIKKDLKPGKVAAPSPFEDYME
jgi:hypothetical protein